MSLSLRKLMGNRGKGAFTGCFCTGRLSGEGAWGGRLFKEGHFFLASAYFWILSFVAFHSGSTIDGVVFPYHLSIWNYGGKLKKGGAIKPFMLANPESCNPSKLQPPEVIFFSWTEENGSHRPKTPFISLIQNGGMGLYPPPPLFRRGNYCWLILRLD